MITTAAFLQYAQWAGILTLACGVLTVLAFILQWGIRFRLVGVTGFMGVVAGGLFALGLVPFTRTVIPGAVPYRLVYDTGGSQTVIRVAPQITETQLEATMRQAASNLFSYGRLGRESQLTIRVRTTIHPKPGVTKPLLLGQVKRSLSTRDDEKMAIEIFRENLAQLPSDA